jgi:predicted ester cyclase
LGRDGAYRYAHPGPFRRTDYSQDCRSAPLGKTSALRIRNLIRLRSIQCSVSPGVDILTSFCEGVIVIFMLKPALVLALMLADLPVGSVAQSGSARVPSAQQKLVLSYFHDILDGRKIDLVENIFQPDCALHFGSADVKGVAGVHSMVERINTTYSSLATEVHDIFESGDRVVVRVTHRATGAGALRSRIGTYDVNGKSITWDAMVIFQIKYGRIAEEWVNRDELGALLSAGILKAN